MTTCEVDELIAFERVRVVGSTAAALHCAIGNKHVWLPREHIKGQLWSRGDCGTLLVRRWIALDRHLIVPDVVSRAHVACDGVASPPPIRQMRLLPPSRQALDD
jgi:hypothetical protein